MAQQRRECQIATSRTNERTARSICPAAYINTSGPGDLGKHGGQARPLQNLRSSAPVLRNAL